MAWRRVSRSSAYAAGPSSRRLRTHDVMASWLGGLCWPSFSSVLIKLLEPLTPFVSHPSGLHRCCCSGHPSKPPGPSTRQHRVRQHHGGGSQCGGVWQPWAATTWAMGGGWAFHHCLGQLAALDGHSACRCCGLAVLRFCSKAQTRILWDCRMLNGFPLLLTLMRLLFSAVWQGLLDGKPYPHPLVFDPGAQVVQIAGCDWLRLPNQAPRDRQGPTDPAVAFTWLGRPPILHLSSAPAKARVTFVGKSSAL